MNTNHMEDIKNLVSVIVPAYNAESYIDRCLRSICCQSYENLEIIVVDDGSSDSTFEKAERWAGKDSRIKVFRQNNKGVSAARNVGMRLSRGRYITFVDSDDYLSSNFVESLLPLMACCQMAISGTRCCPVEDEPDSGATPVGGQLLIDVKSDFDINKIKYSDACWGILYDSDLIKKHEILFNESYHYGEDSLFFYQVLTKSERIISVNAKLYTHTINYDGACHNPWSKQRYTAVLSAEEKIATISEYPTTQLCEKVHIVGAYLTTLISLLESDSKEASLAISLKKKSESHLSSLAFSVLKANMSSKSKLRLLKTILSVKKRIKVLQLWRKHSFDNE